MFKSGPHNLYYTVRKCVRFNGINDALCHYGFARLVPDERSIEEALVVYYKIETLRGTALKNALLVPLRALS